MGYSLLIKLTGIIKKYQGISSRLHETLSR